MAIGDLIDQFILAREAEGLSSQTISWYRRMLRSYANFVQMAGRDWQERETIRLYMASLRGEKVQYKDHPYRPPARKALSVATIRAHHRALAAFFNWLVAEGLIRASPMAGIKAPRMDRDLPKVLDEEDFIRMLQAARGNLRDEALLLFLADTGVRDEEARTLLIDDLDLIEQRALVRGKGRKQRYVYFTQATAQALSAYLSSRHDEHPQVFIGTRGPLTANGIYQILRRLAKKSGVKGRFNPHAFRHFFASQYVANGGDLETLRRMLGHSDIDTTRRYLHFRDDVLRRKHDAFSPISRLSDTGNTHPNGGGNPD